MKGIYFAATVGLIIHLVLITVAFIMESIDNNTVWILIFLAGVNFHLVVISLILSDRYMEKNRLSNKEF